VAIVTIITVGLLVLGGDARYVGVFWLTIVGLTWAGYAFSSRRQRQQTGRLRALANWWLSADPTVGRDRGVGSSVPARNQGTGFTRTVAQAGPRGGSGPDDASGGGAVGETGTDGNRGHCSFEGKVSPAT
jgi:hypothetical protein